MYNTFSTYSLLLPTVPLAPTVYDHLQYIQFKHAGKILKSDFGGKEEVMDRIVTIVSSPSLARDQILGFSSLEHASGYNTAR